MRADATRNRDALLRAARELLVERGLDVPLDAVARHAGVGPATLYRRFADRDALLREVALLSLTECRAVADATRAAVAGAPDEPSAARAWHESLELLACEWVGLHLLTLLRTTSPIEDEAMEQERREAFAALDGLLVVLRERALVRPEISSFEAWTLLLAIARPLPGVPASAAAPLVQRHLQVAAAGLRPTGAALAGHVVTQQDAEATAAALAAQRARASDGRLPAS